MLLRISEYKEMGKLLKLGIGLAGLLLGMELAAQSTVVENKILKSRIIPDTEVRYSVYLPEGYALSDRAYPVLYLLHGMWGDHTDWVRYGRVQETADRLVREGKADRMIIVMPDAGNEWYVNHADGKYDYEDMFFRELLPAVEEEYRTIPDKGARAVAGLSMGGYGTLIYALHRPDMFTAAFAMSAGVYEEKQLLEMPEKEYRERFERIFGKREGDAIPAYRDRCDVFAALRRMPEQAKKELKIYAYCGDDDFLFRNNALLWIALRESGLPMEFRVGDGGHTWTFWRSALEEILPSVSAHFHRL